MNTYKLHLAYDGTNYNGWQIQPNATSIMEILEKALHAILREEVRLIGSGRTDGGVHALEQVAHFRTEQEVDTKRLFISMNGMIPHDIRLLQIEKVDSSFHAQRSAKRKIYHYHLCIGPIVRPFDRLYCTHIRDPIDIELLKEAAKRFIGTHDFKSFANSASKGAAGKNAVRTIFRIDVIETASGVRLEFEGNGFLYKMVRNIVGMMLSVASKRSPLEEIDHLFEAKDRRRSPKSAPARGLFLVKVIY